MSRCTSNLGNPSTDYAIYFLSELMHCSQILHHLHNLNDIVLFM